MKLLLLHQTRSGSMCATGQLLASLSSGLHEAGASISELSCDIDKVGPAEGWHDMGPLLSGENLETELLKIFASEQPGVVIFRPDSRIKSFIEPVMGLKDKLGFNLIVSFMDLWHQKGEEELVARLIRKADALWFISESMQKYYRSEFGGAQPSFVIANGVDMQFFRFPEISKRRKLPLICRFFGSINEYQTYEGLDRVGQAVSKMRGVYLFEIYSRQQGTKLAKSLLKHEGVRLFPPIEGDAAYFSKMVAADVLIIPYSWNQETIAYLKHSFGNKIPECLASGKPIVALGSEELFNVSYLKESGLAEVVTTPDKNRCVTELGTILERISKEYDSCLDRADMVRRFALEKFGIERQKSEFVKMLGLDAQR